MQIYNFFILLDKLWFFEYKYFAAHACNELLKTIDSNVPNFENPKRTKSLHPSTHYTVHCPLLHTYDSVFCTECCIMLPREQRRIAMRSARYSGTRFRVGLAWLYLPMKKILSSEGRENNILFMIVLYIVKFNSIKNILLLNFYIHYTYTWMTYTIQYIVKGIVSLLKILLFTKTFSRPSLFIC